MRTFVTIILILLSIKTFSQEVFDAYKKQDFEKVKMLIKSGDNPNQLNDENGMSLMFLAAGDNNVNLMYCL